MRNITCAQNGVGKRHANLLVGLALVLASSACSKKETPQAPTFQSKPTTTSVVRASWGSAAGQLGQNVPEEGLPEGPRSFAVDAGGTLHVLDQENGRIQKFASGQSAGSVDLPPRPFDDVVLGGSSGYALLDVHSEPAIVFVDASGAIERELPFAMADIDEPSMITALERMADGYYVEVGDEYLVHVADASGKAIEPGVIPGQAIVGGKAIKVDASDARHLSVFQVALPEGEPKHLTDVGFSENVGARTLLAGTQSGSVLLAVHLTSEQADPEQPENETHTLVALGSSGSESYRIQLPKSDSPLDMFRTVKRGEDGNVYVMTANAEGVEIAKVTP